MVIFNLIRRLWFPFFASIPIATFFLFGFFTGPISDDFCFAQKLVRRGFLGAFQRNYLNSDGRYVSNSVLFLGGYLDHSSTLAWYWLISTSLILAIIFSTYFLLHTINRFCLQSTLRKSQIVTASIVLASIYLLSLDRPSEVIYWFSGAVTYQLANVLFTLVLATLVRLYFAKTRAKKFFLLAASMLLVFLIIGHNETVMAVTISVLGLSVLASCLSYHEDRAKSYRVMLICVLTVGIMASLIVILAPGNPMRIQREAQRWGMNQADSISEFLQAGFNALIWAATSSLRWIVTQPYHCFAIFLALVVTSNFPRSVQEYIESKSLLWFPLIGFVSIWVGAFTSFYLGISPPGRAIASIYVVFWLSFIPTGLVLMRRYGWELHGRGLITTLKVALVGSTLLHPHYPQATRDFKDIVLYGLQLHERERIVNNAVQEGHRDVVVPRLMRVPATIHYRDLSEDKSHYYNRCYASYMGINSIIALGDGDTSRIIREFNQKVSSQMDRLVPWR
jgi:Family of unknown function (DUF6056)